MPYCTKCLRLVCTPCTPANDNYPPKLVIVASDSELLRRSYFQRLAIATKALELPRREIPNWVADVIYACEGSIVWPNGDRFVIDDEDIDAAFNDDGSFRWLSDFLRFAEVPPRQAPQLRVLSRLRLIDLAMRIAHPSWAGHIGR